MAQGPHELEFVVTMPATGTVRQHDGVDMYLPDDADRPLPAVVIVPGPVPDGAPRPRRWPLFSGYGRLLANRGVAGVVTDLPYHSPADWQRVAGLLAGTVDSVRALDEVDADRIAVWAFSGGALLVGRWLAEPPPWLRCLAMNYPLLAPGDVAPGLPVVLTRVGKERPEWQATVDSFLARATTAVHVVDVPNGQHGFDCADHTEESRQAVVEAADLVVRNL
jgi:dienelactone hydrolase